MSDTGINERLENFGKAVLKHAQSIQNELFEEVNDYTNKELGKNETEQLREIHDKIKAEVAEIELEATRKVSKAIIANKKSFYEKRHECLENVFKQAEKKLLEFANSVEYKSFIIEKASKLPKYAQSVIMVRESDMSLAEDIKKAYGAECDVVSDENIEIGGIILENKAEGIYIDESFKSILEDNKDWFCAESGLMDK